MSMIRKILSCGNGLTNFVSCVYVKIKVVKFVLFLLFLTSYFLYFQSISFSNTLGNLPTGSQVNSDSKNQVETQNEVSEASVKLVLKPAVYVSNWSNNIVGKYTNSWGRPVNPAENIFYLQNDIPSFFNINLDFKVGEFKLYMELPIEREYGNKISTLSNHTNFPFDFSIDLNFPEIAYLHYSNNTFYFSIGRYKLSWGDARYPIHISPTTSLDNFTLSINFPGIVYTFHSISSFPLLAPEEETIQSNYSDQHTDGRYFKAPSKYIFAHRLDFFNILSDEIKLRIGLGELNIVGGRVPDITDFSPVLIYHNTYGEGWSNVTGSIDFSLVYKNTLKIYGEFVLDDLLGPTEIGYTYKPGAFGFNIGGQFTVPISIGNLNVWLEYGETSEWMYVTNYLPYLRINVRKFYIQNVPGARFLVDYPLGFIYGPDAKMFSFGVDGNIQKYGINYSFEYNRLIKGQVNDNGVIRWKWFWDSWPGNVSESGANTPPKAEDVTYDLYSLRVGYSIFEIFAKVTKNENNFNYFIGLNTILSFKF
ncbi:MAG: hypothetical protein ACK4R7_00065 [Fervidobacterium sp.]